MYGPGDGRDERYNLFWPGKIETPPRPFGAASGDKRRAINTDYGYTYTLYVITLYTYEYMYVSVHTFVM